MADKLQEPPEMIVRYRATKLLRHHLPCRRGFLSRCPRRPSWPFQGPRGPKSWRFCKNSPDKNDLNRRESPSTVYGCRVGFLVLS